MPSSKIINIEESADTPKVALDAEGGVFLIEGHSYPEDAYIIFDPVLDWLRGNEIPFRDPQICNFKFKVLSSASRKLVYEILLELEKMSKQNGGIEVHWHFEKFDEDMLEVGEDFTEIVDIPFKLCPI